MFPMLRALYREKISTLLDDLTKNIFKFIECFFFCFVLSCFSKEKEELLVQ